MFDRYYCIKSGNICCISRYFVHYFVLPFHRCLADAISTDYARSMAGQNTSRNGSKSVASVRSYSKLRSRALTARELPCFLIHGFSTINARLLITCDTAFYAIMYGKSYFQAHQGTDLYMRGNALGFMWKEGAKINKTGSNTWQAVITYQSANDGFRCHNCSDNSGFIGPYFQYRIYIDDRIDMIGGNMQVRIPISKSSSYFDDTPKYFAYPWFFSKEGNGTAVSIESPQTGRNFSIVIYRPPSFEENTFKTYPTVLVFDFSEEIYKAVATIMAAPTVEKGTIGEYILIGFGECTSQDDRTNLLTQVPGPSHECINGTYDTQCDNCFPAGINYTEYIWYMINKCGKQVETGGKGNKPLTSF